MSDTINGQPDLSSLPAREEWGRTHGLPPGFVIVTKSELTFIQERTQQAMNENLKYRAIARLLFGARTVEEFAQKAQDLQKEIVVSRQRRVKP